MPRVFLEACVASLLLSAAVPRGDAQMGPPGGAERIRQPTAVMRYADFADLNPRFSWMRENPELTFQVSSIDLGGCPEVKSLCMGGVRWALGSEAQPGFSGFDRAEVYCRAEADGRRFVGVAFVVTPEIIRMFCYRLAGTAFVAPVERLGECGGGGWGSAYGFHVLTYRGAVTHVLFFGQWQQPAGEDFVVVTSLASGRGEGYISAPFRVVEEDEGEYLYALERRPQRAKELVEITGLRFGGTETLTLFQEQLPCKTESCDSPEDLAPAVKRLDTYLQGKKLLPIRME